MAAQVPYPEFAVSLTRAELEELGYFNAVWSQIDVIVTLLLAIYAKTEIADIIDMTGGATTAPRVAMLRKLAARNNDNELVKACKDMKKLIGLRNHLAHGVWGVRVPGGGKPPVASCHYHGEPHSPFDASRLGAAIDLASEASHALGKVLRRLTKKPGPDHSHMFYFGEEEPKHPPPAFPVTLREHVGRKT